MGHHTFHHRASMPPPSRGWGRLHTAHHRGSSVRAPSRNWRSILSRRCKIHAMEPWSSPSSCLETLTIAACPRSTRLDQQRKEEAARRTWGCTCSSSDLRKKHEVAIVVIGRGGRCCGCHHASPPPAWAIAGIERGRMRWGDMGESEMWFTCTGEVLREEREI
jgi:hypothetical protein